MGAGQAVETRPGLDAGSLSARLDRLPATRTVWKLLGLLSSGVAPRGRRLGRVGAQRNNGRVGGHTAFLDACVVVALKYSRRTQMKMLYLLHSLLRGIQE